MAQKTKPARDCNQRAFDMVRALEEATSHDGDHTQPTDKVSDGKEAKGPKETNPDAGT